MHYVHIRYYIYTYKKYILHKSTYCRTNLYTTLLAPFLLFHNIVWLTGIVLKHHEPGIMDPLSDIEAKACNTKSTTNPHITSSSRPVVVSLTHVYVPGVGLSHAPLLAPAYAMLL